MTPPKIDSRARNLSLAVAWITRDGWPDMIRRPQSWNSSDPTGWTAAQREYGRYLKKNEHRFPPALARFVREFTLHDDRIRECRAIGSVPSGRDLVLTIEKYADGCVGTVALILMHFVGVRGATRLPDCARTIMYFDVEIVERSLFRLSILQEGGKQWSVRFSDFGSYIHDYRGGRAHQAANRTPVSAPRKFGRQ